MDSEVKPELNEDATIESVFVTNNNDCEESDDESVDPLLMMQEDGDDGCLEVDAEEEQAYLDKILLNLSQENSKIDSCLTSLLSASDVINRMLHKKECSNENDLLQLRAESKKTRRNSQYKTYAINIFWYIAFCLVNKREPVLPKIPRDEKKDHYNKFIGKKDYSYEMVCALHRNMNKIIDFAITQFFLYYATHMNIEFEIKKLYKEIQQKTQQLTLLAFKRPIVKSEDDMDTDTSVHHAGSNKTGKSKQELMASKEASLEKLEELKIKSKRPHILSKLYMALLFESDYELLFLNIQRRLNTIYPDHQMTKLLQSAIYYMCNLALPTYQKAATIDMLQNFIKSRQLSVVVKILLNYGIQLKYNKFDIDDSNTPNNYNDVLDIKNYSTKARNTKINEYFATKVPVELDSEIYKFNNLDYVVIVFKSLMEDKVTKFIYDCLSITGIDQKIFDTLSWSQRLSLCSVLSVMKAMPTIIVKPITKMQIQFDIAPAGNKISYYIKTCGFGFGTKFFKGSKANPPPTNSNKRGSRPTAKRSPKIRKSDLVATRVKRYPQMNAVNILSNYYHHQQEMQQQQQERSPYYVLSPYASPNRSPSPPPPPLGINTFEEAKSYIFNQFSEAQIMSGSVPQSHNRCMYQCSPSRMQRSPARKRVYDTDDDDDTVISTKLQKLTSLNKNLFETLIKMEPSSSTAVEDGTEDNDYDYGYDYGDSKEFTVCKEEEDD